MCLALPTGKDTDENMTSLFLHTPIVSVTAAKAVDSKVRAAIVTWNAQHLARQTGSKAYASRTEAFTEFAKLI